MKKSVETNHEVSGGIVADCARINSRASCRMSGRSLANAAAPIPQATAPAATVACAPMCSAKHAGNQRPDRRHPHQHHRIGCQYAAALSGVILWIRVLVEPIWIITKIRSRPAAPPRARTAGVSEHDQAGR